MEFPAYVPAAVREHITVQINGDNREPMGWAAALASAEKSLEAAERAFDDAKKNDWRHALDEFRKDLILAKEHRDSLLNNVECFQRLALDPRMRDAYALLTTEFSKDQEWRDFIHAAWQADIDFAPYRERLKKARDLKEKIADAAKKLSKLLKDVEDIGYDDWPAEFFSIPALLRKTDNAGEFGRNLHMWRGLRSYILGDSAEGDFSKVLNDNEDNEEENSEKIEIVLRPISSIEQVKLSPDEERQNTLNSAWNTAPDFSALLDTVAKAANNFEPMEFDVIGVAIESRQRNPKTEYIRAFSKLLTDGYGFKLNQVVMKAMAVITNVVINQDVIGATYDDVRKALSKNKG